jgi:hypothetical protein
MHGDFICMGMQACAWPAGRPGSRHARALHSVHAAERRMYARREREDPACSSSSYSVLPSCCTDPSRSIDPILLMVDVTTPSSSLESYPSHSLLSSLYISISLADAECMHVSVLFLLTPTPTQAGNSSGTAAQVCLFPSYSLSLHGVWLCHACTPSTSSYTFNAKPTASGYCMRSCLSTLHMHACMSMCVVYICMYTCMHVHCALLHALTAGPALPCTTPARTREIPYATNKQGTTYVLPLLSPLCVSLPQPDPALPCPASACMDWTTTRRRRHYCNAILIFCLYPQHSKCCPLARRRAPFASHRQHAGACSGPARHRHRHRLTPH